ncbi:MAG TPA: hypothetical protein VGH54_21485 [Mycobacterium sp.]|jgi:hypothetical protein|uniref:hypothetical protein n=1 Tax=Mycobacterium sp. TaxID=1785 RepID=UPI002F3F6CAD
MAIAVLLILIAIFVCCAYQSLVSVEHRAAIAAAIVAWWVAPRHRPHTPHRRSRNL